MKIRRPCLCGKGTAPELFRSLADTLRSPSMQDFEPLLRNGGAEATVKALLLGRLEHQLGCISITERSRVDLILVCRDCCGAAARIEFKSNFASQLALVKGRRDEAVLQLSRPTSTVAANLYYIQFLTSMRSEAGSHLSKVHDELVPGYKKFSKNQLDDADKAIRTAVGTSCGRIERTAVLPAAVDPTCGVQLWCWGEQFDERTGRWEPID